MFANAKFDMMLYWEALTMFYVAVKVTAGVPIVVDEGNEASCVKLSNPESDGVIQASEVPLSD